jgi:hypothetical protein
MLSGCAEVRSQQDGGTGHSTGTFVGMLASHRGHVVVRLCLSLCVSVCARLIATGQSGGSMQSQGGALRAKLSVHLRGEINPVIIFRALGFVADRDVLEHVVYDVSDAGDRDMMDLLQPSLEESMYFQVRLVYGLAVRV